MLDVLPTDALCTDVLATCVFTSPNELIVVKEEVAPTQLTTNELCKLEKLSFTLSFARNILNRSVLVSTKLVLYYCHTIDLLMETHHYHQRIVIQQMGLDLL